MCGIAGFIDKRTGADASTSALGAMLESIHHRGPDGEGRLVSPGHGIYAGMRRLSIIDLAGGDQPIWNETDDIAVLFNGEIYNYRELRADLQAKGHRFRTAADTEVLVHLYEEYGEDMLRHLRGMYAFFIFDRPGNSAFLARDPFGQKPLYYTSGGDRFAFASELKALRHLDWVRWDENQDAYLIYLTWLSLPAPFTHFESIRKLEPGAALRIDLDHVDNPRRLPPWSYLDAAACAPSPAPPTLDELESVLTESVRLHLRSDVPVGVFLSGGLDSKLITTLLARELDTPLQTFTAVFDGDDSEQADAEATARSLGLTNQKVQIQSDNLGQQIFDVLRHLDEPVGDPAAFAVSQLAAEARKSVKVVLSGEGSDELFGGYFGRYHGIISTLERSAKLKRLRAFIPATHNLAGGSCNSLRLRSNLSPSAELTWLRKEGLPLLDRGTEVFTLPQQRRLIALCDELGERLSPSGGESSPLERCLAFDIRWQLPEFLLQKADKMTMRHSLELRAPFLDLKVAAAASAIPAGSKLNSQAGVGKSILRELMTKLDPSEDLLRPKKGFPMPFADWFRSHLRDEIESTIFHPQSTASQRLNVPALRSAWSHFQTHGSPHHMWSFYALWSYELWKQSLPQP